MRNNKLIHWILLVSFIAGACVLPSVGPRPVTEVLPTPLFSLIPPQQLPPSARVISYAEVAEWLEDVSAEEHEDQIRDWAVHGLIELLGLDLDTVTGNVFDQTPVRDGFFNGTGSLPVGPGRGFFDGQDTLHVLVPSGDPYAGRTIALVLDDFRTNAGNDVGQVILHHYQIDQTLQQVTIESEQPQATDVVRQSHGYVEKQISSVQDLESFLGTTDHLSQVRVLNDQIWVAGWNWSNVPVGYITLQDVSALAEGYSNALAGGYSLEDEEALRASYNNQVAAGSIDQQTADRFFEIENRNRRAAASEPGFSLDGGVVLPPQEALTLLVSSGKYPVFASEVGSWQSSFQAWANFTSLDQRQQTAVDLIDKYFDLRDREEESAEVVASMFDSRVFLETALAWYPNIGGYAADLRSKFDLLSNPALPPADRYQIESEIYDLASQVESIESNAAAFIRWGASQRDRPVYQVARYDGALHGTEAAMTYFYTDLVAKAWSLNIGQGVPYQAVNGFVPDPLAQTPLGFCPASEASGRLWFGLRPEGVDVQPTQINLGGLTTRVFTLIENGSSGDEIEPDYSFGRIIWWWDRHYNAMADYEPQYYRLDQLTRWGAVLAWLKGDPDLPQLPTLPPDQVIKDRRFDTWLNEHAADLKWKYDVPFVQPPGESTEALLTLYSTWFEDCGGQWQFSGGISAPGFDDIATLARQRPSLPKGVARADLNNVATQFDEITKTGQISRSLPDGNVNWTFEAPSETKRLVTVEAPGSKAWSLGPARITLEETVNKKILKTIEKVGNGHSQRYSVQFGDRTIPFGDFSSAGVTERMATVTFTPGPLADIRRALSRLENRLKGQTSFPDAISQLEGADYKILVSDTEAYLKFDDEMMLLRNGAPDALPDESLGFRIGQPGVEDAPPIFYELQPSTAPDLAGDWFKMDRNRLLNASDAPPPDAVQLNFRSASGSGEGTIYVSGEDVFVNQGDALFGLNGSSHSMLADVATKIKNIQTETQLAPESLARGVLASDDSLVLIEPKTLTLVDSSDPRFGDLQTAFKTTPEAQLRFVVDQDFIAWAAKVDGPIVYQSPQSVSLDAFFKANQVDSLLQSERGPPMALERSLLDESTLFPGAIGLEQQVQIIQIDLSLEAQTMIQNGVKAVQWNGRPLVVISNGQRSGGSANAGGNGTPSPSMPPEYLRLTIICPEGVCAPVLSNPTPTP